MVLERLKEVVNQNNLSICVDPESPRINSPISLDVEHDEQGNMVCIGVYDGTAGICFTQISERLSHELSRLEIIAHNGIGDFECLRSWGIDIKYSQLTHDTMLIGHLIDPSLKSYGLKDMAKRELAIEYPSYDEIVGKHRGKTVKHPACNKQPGCDCERITLEKQPLEIVSLYNALDCYVTFKLYLKQKGLIENGNL